MSDKIYVQIDNEKMEAQGAVLTEYLEYKAIIDNASITADANAKAKADAKASAMAKLTALGLTADEVNAIVGT